MFSKRRVLGIPNSLLVLGETTSQSFMVAVYILSVYNKETKISQYYSWS